MKVHDNFDTQYQAACMCFELLQKIDYAAGFTCEADPDGNELCPHDMVVTDGVQVHMRRRKVAPGTGACTVCV